MKHDGTCWVVPCAGVRKNCLMVLSHLILNDMMKVKGHIARLALCLQDDEPRIAGLAQVFFHELSAKASKVRIMLRIMMVCAHLTAAAAAEL